VKLGESAGKTITQLCFDSPASNAVIMHDAATVDRWRRLAFPAPLFHPITNSQSGQLEEDAK